jgi:DNA primase
VSIDDGEIAQVRAGTDIVALISEHVALKKTGRRWSGLCPFHAEKSPSFSVNAEEGLYYCFGCRASGDAIKFVRETQHLDFRDAVQMLADKAGVELHDTGGGAGRQERQELFDVMARAVSWYHERLLSAPDGGTARQYLRSRGIDGDQVRQFQLGWAPDEWGELATHLNVPTKLLTSVGLGFANASGRQQDFLRARVVFPISDSAGRPIAVGGRIIPGTESGRPGRVEPKYKNSPETPIYSKRRTLYALNLAKKGVIEAEEMIVCEGYTDVIGLFSADLPRAVATCGTSLTEEHFRTMRNFAKRIILAYDADAAGQSAAASVYQWERTHEVDVAVVRLPPGSDPGDLARTDPEALRAAVANAVPYLQFRLDRVLAGANLSSPEGRARAAEMAVGVVAEHPVELVRDQYLGLIADQCRVDVDQLRPLLARVLRGGALSPASSSAAPDPRRVVSAGSRPAAEALALLVHAPTNIDGRLVAPYFLDADQRAAFVALEGGVAVAAALDVLESSGASGAAQVLREVVVAEIDNELFNDRAVTAVVAQLIRGAATAAMRDVDLDIRGGIVLPDSAFDVIKTIKLRLAELEGPAGDAAETELRAWLVERDGETGA